MNRTFVPIFEKYKKIYIAEAFCTLFEILKKTSYLCWLQDSSLFLLLLRQHHQVVIRWQSTVHPLFVYLVHKAWFATSQIHWLLAGYGGSIQPRLAMTKGKLKVHLAKFETGQNLIKLVFAIWWSSRVDLGLVFGPGFYHSLGKTSRQNPLPGFG